MIDEEIVRARLMEICRCLDYEYCLETVLTYEFVDHLIANGVTVKPETIDQSVNWKHPKWIGK